MSPTHPLDRPVWSALNTRVAPLAIRREQDGGAAVRLDPDVGVFVAAADDTPPAGTEMYDPTAALNVIEQTSPTGYEPSAWEVGATTVGATTEWTPGDTGEAPAASGPHPLGTPRSWCAGHISWEGGETANCRCSRCHSKPPSGGGVTSFPRQRSSRSASTLTI